MEERMMMVLVLVLCWSWCSGSEETEEVLLEREEASAQLKPIISVSSFVLLRSGRDRLIIRVTSGCTALGFLLLRNTRRGGLSQGARAKGARPNVQPNGESSMAQRYLLGSGGPSVGGAGDETIRKRSSSPGSAAVAVERNPIATPMPGCGKRVKKILECRRTDGDVGDRLGGGNVARRKKGKTAVLLLGFGEHLPPKKSILILPWPHLDVTCSTDSGDHQSGYAKL